jgi:hypothetical protein
MTFPGVYFCHQKVGRTSEECVWCAQNAEKGENLFIYVVNVKQGCVYMSESRSNIQTSNSNPVASIINMQRGQVIR